MTTKHSYEFSREAIGDIFLENSGFTRHILSYHDSRWEKVEGEERGGVRVVVVGKDYDELRGSKIPVFSLWTSPPVV